MDETGGGGYDLALSTTPGDMNPPSEGCKSLFGGFGHVDYINQAQADILKNTPSPHPGDPLHGFCVVDTSKTYYFNVHVVKLTCDASNTSTPKCSPIILQDSAFLVL
ncbi:MAG TPA: hypothetical protein ENK23_03930 [Sorangium sp.]|nr:hypothetical protein [Sorangium sp.]